METHSTAELLRTGSNANKARGGGKPTRTHRNVHVLLSNRKNRNQGEHRREERTNLTAGREPFPVNRDEHLTEPPMYEAIK